MIDYEITLEEKHKELIIEVGMQTKAFKKLQRTMQIGIIIVGVLVLLLGILTHSSIFTFGCIIFFVMAACISPIQKRGARDTMKKQDARIFEGVRHYIVDDNGIDITSYAGNSKLLWDAFVDYGEYRNFTWIQTADRRVVIIDRGDLREEELVELDGYLKRYIRK